MIKTFKTVILLIFICFFSCQNSNLGIRHSAVSGSFYPAEKNEIINLINKYFNKTKTLENSKNIIGLISPHAGYVYSGQTAAWAYRQIEKKQYDTIIILGVSHSTMLQYPSIYEGDYYNTPMGNIKLDKIFINALKKKVATIYNESAHIHEHSIEVQLPFLQYLYGQKIPPVVPILVSTFNSENWKKLGLAINELIKGKKCLVIASSDMSHFPPYETAVNEDKITLDLIKNYDIAKLISREIEFEKARKNNMSTTLCGLNAVIVLMEIFKSNKNVAFNIVNYMNSGDIIKGNRQRVVGYGALILKRVNNEY